MAERTEQQISQWLKKLERESWQLELLVSAFTIFLLITASESLDKFAIGLSFKYYGPVRFLIFFLGLIYASILVLTGFLILHLLLRGFWIGAIGLRSVQPTIDYNRLKYSEFFQNKLQKKLMGLDRLVMSLDELCSVIFSVSFLIIFMIISFGLYSLFVILLMGSLTTLIDIVDMEVNGAILFIVWSFFIVLIFTGIIYLVDYLTLGFFKKFRGISKIYYPIYRLYGTITLSFISRSIYYNLISKYSKKRIRLLLLFFLIFIISTSFINFDQYQYFPEGENDLILENNYYDDLRPGSDYVEKVSVESKFFSKDFISLFIRYNPQDNRLIKSNCPDFEPLKNDGINSAMKFQLDNGLSIRFEEFDEENKEMLLDCLSEFYQVSVNDSICEDLNYYFYEHPAKSQRGILTIFSSDHFRSGENIIQIKRKYIDPSDSLISKDFARVPVWVAH